MPYNDSMLSARDRQRIAALQKQWEEATARGDAAGAEEYHRQAESIRQSYGYTGGDDGEHYSDLDISSDDRSYYIRRLSAASEASTLSALRDAYDGKLAALDRSAARIPGYYRRAKNAAASDAEIEKANLAERFSANGLNTGTSGQAYLAQSMALRGNLASLDEAQASELADLEYERLSIENDYRSAVASAIEKNELSLAQSLYDEYVRKLESAGKSSYGGSSLSYQPTYSSGLSGRLDDRTMAGIRQEIAMNAKSNPDRAKNAVYAAWDQMSQGQKRQIKEYLLTFGIVLE